MPLFRFKIADSAGTASETIVEAENQKDAVKRLRMRKAVVLEFLGNANDMGRKNEHIFKRHRFDCIDFTDRLVPLLQSGITLEKSLQVLNDSSENPDEKTLLGDLRRGLHEGKPMSKLIRDRGKLFPRIYSSIVEAGEESGSLALVMGELRKFLLSGRELKSFLVSASIYPIFVLLISFGVVLLMLSVVVPKFAVAFKKPGKSLPASLEFLMGISDFIANFWWLGLIIFVAIAFFIRALGNDGPVKAWWDNFVLKIPIIGNVVHLNNLTRLLRTLSTLLKSGVHLLDAVTISIKVVDNGAIRDSISFLSNDLRKGERLSIAFAKSPYISPMILRMLAIGEETGQPAEMMANTAERLEEDVKKKIKKVVTLFEPLMIVFLAIVVGSILIIMFMAIMEMQSAM